MKHQFEHIPAERPADGHPLGHVEQPGLLPPGVLRPGDEESLEEAAARLISKVRTIAAFSYRRSLGLPFIYPDPNLRYCANFLHMMFSIPYSQYIVTREVEDALNLIFILHADHEQNCSTSTVRHGRLEPGEPVRLRAPPASARCGGRCTAGPTWRSSRCSNGSTRAGSSPRTCISAAKDKTNPFRLFGFGHRVYKNYDPRAKILKEECDKVLAKLKRQDPLLDIARKLEELALNDPYFIERKLYPNVDFYSGIILRAIGIPTNMFTVLFAIGRLPGWIAQWKEQHDDPNTKIQRPRQIYTGPTETTTCRWRNGDSQPALRKRSAVI